MTLLHTINVAIKFQDENIVEPSMQRVPSTRVSIVELQALEMGSILCQRMKSLFYEKGRLGKTKDLDCIIVTYMIG